MQSLVIVYGLSVDATTKERFLPLRLFSLKDFLIFDKKKQIVFQILKKLDINTYKYIQYIVYSTSIYVYIVYTVYIQQNTTTLVNGHLPSKPIIVAKMACMCFLLH